MAFVLDASVAASWALKDESHSVAALAMSRLLTEEALVPALWWFEIRNTMVVNERRSRITESDTAGFLGYVARLGIRQDRKPDEAQVLDLARRHRLTVYDAAYLELAQREGLPLATLDSRLASAARAEKVPLIGDRRVAH